MAKISLKKDKINSILYKGVSLIELLLVISIIAILTASITPTISSFNKDQNLNQATENIATEIKTLRDKAVSGAVVNPNDTAERVWWGFSCNGDQYELGQASNNASSLPSTFDTVQTKEVSTNSNIQISCTPFSTFYFKRLTGELHSASDYINTLEVEVTDSGSGNSKKITIFKTGKIIVE